MAKPRQHHLQVLERIGRYLMDAPRVVQTFKWQSEMKNFEEYSDFDWVGDRVSRKSTSGGVCKVGPHIIKIWSSIQNIIVLSSAEVEALCFVEVRLPGHRNCQFGF